MTREAKIKCPHCGAQITVRATDAKNIALEDAAEIRKAFEEMTRTMDAMFRKVFNPRLWR